MIDENKYNSTNVFEHESNNKGVITYKTLIDLVIEQAPPGERGKLLRNTEIKLDEVNNIRIEFLEILKIDLLWGMKNLVKLTLSHNVIEKIENLDELSKLEELDLSFNRIKKMENLNRLTQLEILLLAGNQIEEIQEIDELKKLVIFSIANNNIQTWDHVVYFRKLEKLRSVNMTGNPCTEKEDYNNYLIAFLPQLIYSSYVLINGDDRTQALQTYKRDIMKIEKEELEIKNILNEKWILEQKTATDFISFVENLDGDEFFNNLFLDDKDGLVLKMINDETLALFEDYKKNITAICHELYEFGINQHHQRLEEINEFTGVIKNARDVTCDNSRQIVDTILEERNRILMKFKSSIDDEPPDSNLNTESSSVEDMKDNRNIIKVQEFEDELNEFLSEMRAKLLEDHVVLHEQFEDVIEIFKNNLTDMKDNFLDFVRNSFSKMRKILIQYRDNIDKAVNLYINDIGDESSVPNHLINLCGDANVLSNTLTKCYNIHSQIIDNREKTIINRLNLWLENLIDEFSNKENAQYRQRILEISNFLQFQYDQIYKDFLGNDKLVLDVAAILEG